MNEGQIIERGKHDELLAAGGGFYHDLYMSQFRYEAALSSDDGKEPADVTEMRKTGVVGAS